MRQPKTIPAMLLIALVLGFLFSISTSYATDIESSSDEIERVEIGENKKTVYYKNGLREVFFTVGADMTVDTSVGTTHVRSIPTPPPKPPDITEIFKIIRQILDLLGVGGVGCALLAWKVWNVIKSLRGNRPRDYYGVGTLFK